MQLNNIHGDGSINSAESPPGLPYGHEPLEYDQVVGELPSVAVAILSTPICKPDGF